MFREYYIASIGFSHQGASNSLLIELGGVSVVRVKRFQDAIEQDTYCSVTGKTSQQEKVMNLRHFRFLLIGLDIRWSKQAKVLDCNTEKK